MSNFSLIYITAPSKREAQKIAGILVKEKLAACCNIFPITSIYKGQGRLQKEKEFGMIIKTRKKLFEKIKKKIKKIHSYKVPCIISFEIEKGFKEFLNWIENQTK